LIEKIQHIFTKIIKTWRENRTKQIKVFGIVDSRREKK